MPGHGIQALPVLGKQQFFNVLVNVGDDLFGKGYFGALLPEFQHPGFVHRCQPLLIKAGGADGYKMVFTKQIFPVNGGPGKGGGIGALGIVPAERAGLQLTLPQVQQGLLVRRSQTLQTLFV